VLLRFLALYTAPRFAELPPLKVVPFPPESHAPVKLKVIFCVRGVISPLLANLYMNRFLKYWRITGKGKKFRAQVVNYADDFVILSRGQAVEALDWTRGVMGLIGLTLNEAKAHIRKANSELPSRPYRRGRSR